jgi:hypothetical protein
VLILEGVSHREKAGLCKIMKEELKRVDYKDTLFNKSRKWSRVILETLIVT